MGRLDPANLNDKERKVLTLVEENPNSLVYFSANWCGACRTFKHEALDTLVADGEFERRGVKLIEVDNDECPTLSVACKVKSLPAVMVFRDGKHVDGFSGYQPRGDVLECLREHYPLPEEG